jgi:UDP:flavonoid glycosyltransferase YjiC (YdhE family)
LLAVPSAPKSTEVKRVLFVAEAVTLAQVVRLLTLARALPADEFDVHFAAATSAWPVVDAQHLRRHPLHSLTPAQVEGAVRRGTRLYSRRTLARYVEDDLRLLDAVQPDLVVGDLRWSLSVSAPLRGVPTATLINAYWSPHAIRDGFPLPHHPVVRVLGEELAGRHFRKALPFVFRYFARPLDALRVAHRMPPLGGLLEVLTDGTLTLYPDVPELVPTGPLPPTHHFLGPVLWQPEVPWPEEWEPLDLRPVVYVTLGSSGPVHLLPALIDALARLPVRVLVATAGRLRLEHVPPNVLVADYLPGEAAVRTASVVVTNGGSSSGYQALAQGRPVVGIPWNLDQLLATQAIEAAGAGTSVRAHLEQMPEVGRQVEAALGGAFRAGAARAQSALNRLDSGERFLAVVRHWLGPSPTTSA